MANKLILNFLLRLFRFHIAEFGYILLHKVIRIPVDSPDLLAVIQREGAV